MLYITGLHALNIPCELDTPSQWHNNLLNWDPIPFRDSENSIFKDYGLQYNLSLENYSGKYAIANHIRAYLDLIELNDFNSIQGLGLTYFYNPIYMRELFDKTYILQKLDHWHSINQFLSHEFHGYWDAYHNTVLQNLNDVAKSEIIADIVHFINNNSNNFVLKGGAALSLCYNSSRFTEDIDFDSPSNYRLLNLIDKYCHTKNYTYRIARDTLSKEKFFIYYFSPLNPLKVEIEFENIIIPTNEITSINNIEVYSINDILLSKFDAFSSRDKSRDIYL